MSKRIESPINRWPGYVLLRYPTPLETYEAWKQSVERITQGDATVTTGDVATNDAHLRNALPGICAMVEEWHLEGDFPKVVTPDTFPFLPRVPSVKAIVWLMGEINAIIAEDDDLPLA